ncbi:MAG: SsrA-binding protein SmpB [Planctomycetota bacterium]
MTATKAKTGGKQPEGKRVLVRNRRAFHEYQILESWEAGLVLLGSEVKSLREGGASLDESYLRFDGDELFWVKGHIPEFRHSSGFLNHEPRRKRKVLLRKSQLNKLRAQVQQKGFTLVPLDIHLTDRGLIKLELGLARGKKLADKRQAERSRQDRRDIRDLA